MHAPSDLQLALLAVAAAALIALYGWGKWQEFRLTRRLRERLHAGVGDALLEGGAAREQGWRAAGRMEPVLGPAVAATQPADSGRSAPSGAVSAYGADREDFDLSLPERAAGPADFFVGRGRTEAEELPVAAFAEAVGAPVAGTGAAAEAVSSEGLRTPGALLRPGWEEDPLLDCSLEVRFARAVDGVSVIDAAAALTRTPWTVPVHFVVWDGRSQEWVLPDRFGYYSDALAAIQLADRGGPVTAQELQAFVQTVQALARKLDADVDAPDTARLLEQARALDALCARFDVRIGLTLASSGAPFTGPQLRNAAHGCGFRALASDRWSWSQGEGPELFTLQASSRTPTQVVLELDVGRAPSGAQPFAALVASARELAQTLGARLVDDNGQALEERAIAGIQAQLDRLTGEMRAAGIEPGSARARRLYI
jgi:hypothetical protein